LIPSVREGRGLVATEASSVVTPVVAYDVHGLRDSVRNNETGFLVKNGKIEEMASRACEIILNKKLFDKLATNSLKWASNFSWDQTGKEFLEYIFNVSNQQKIS